MSMRYDEQKQMLIDDETGDFIRPRVIRPDQGIFEIDVKIGKIEARIVGVAELRDQGGLSLIGTHPKIFTSEEKREISIKVNFLFDEQARILKGTHQLNLNRIFSFSEKGKRNG